MSASPGPAAAAREALRRASTNTRRLLASLPGTTVAVPGSLWNAGEIGAHLVLGLRAFTDAVRGRDTAFTTDVGESATFHERLAAINAHTVGLEPQRDLTTLGELVVDATREFLDASTAAADDRGLPTPWYGQGAALDVDAATSLLLGEQLVHGYDIARAVGARWPISPDDARLVFRGVRSMMPLIVDPQAARGVEAVYDVRLRGGDRCTVRVAGGAVRVEDGGGPADCRLSADPVAFLLVGYGRMSQWRAIRSGKLLAWGRRPWLALGFKGLFSNP